jgi:hypothetical protein
MIKDESRDVDHQLNLSRGPSRHHHDEPLERSLLRLAAGPNAEQLVQLDAERIRDRR